MKRITLKLVLILVLSIIMLNTLSLVPSIEASNNDFNDINLIYQPNFLDRDKVTCKITWETSQKILYLKITITLQNQKQQIFETANDSDKFSSIEQTENGKTYFLNTLEFDLYNHQTGNMKIKFDYSYLPVMPGSPMNSVTYVFSTGSWIDKQPAHIAIISGIVITLCCGVITYVVIENSHRVIDETDSSEEDELYDE